MFLHDSRPGSGWGLCCSVMVSTCPRIVLNKIVLLSLFLLLPILLTSTQVSARSAVDDADPANPLFDLELEALMDLEVTSVSKRVQPLSHSPAAVYVITSEELKRSGATSIPDALRLAPGVEVARVNRSTWAVSIRGLNSMYSHNLLVLLDGRSIYSPFYGGVYWDLVMPMLEDIDRIEVIRGPGASLWGVNAVNGVINIISKSAEITQGQRVVASAGNEENHLRLRTGGKYGELFYRGYVVHRDVESATSRETGNSAEDAMQGSQVGARADWVNGRERLTLQTDLSLIEKSYNHSIDSRIESVGDHFDNTGFNVLSRWQKPWNQHELQLQLAFDRVERDEPGYEYRIDTYDVDFQFNHATTENHRITWGANVRFYRDELEESNVLTIQNENNSWHLYSAFIQDEFLVSDKLTLVAGLKAEKNQDVDIDIAWQPTLRFNYKASDKVSYWGSASLATRIPARIENDATFRNEFPEHLKKETLGFLFLQALGASSLEEVLNNPALLDALEAFSERDDIFIAGEIVGQDNLEEEETLALELGVRWLPSPNLFFDFTAYHYDYDNLRSLEFIDWAQTGDNEYLISLTPINLAEAKSHGAELSVEFRYAQDLRFKFNASHLDFEVSGDNGLSAANFLEGVSPENQFSFRTYYDINDRYTLDFDLYYVDEITSGGEDVPTDYADLNLRLAWKASPQLDVSFVLFNLFHDHRYEYQETLVGPQRTEIDRSFFIQLDWQQ